MKNYPKFIKNTLLSVIRDMAKHPEDFCCTPGKDFTRKRKLPFEKVLITEKVHPLPDARILLEGYLLGCVIILMTLPVGVDFLFSGEIHTFS